MALELTFVNQYGESAPKRRRLAKACESCRARKKRCTHFAGTNCSDKASGERDSEEEDSPSRSNGLPTPSSTLTSSKRFISDLNPESTFLHRTRAAAPQEPRPQNEDIGIWVDRREYDALLRQKTQNARDADIEAAAQNQVPHSAVLAPLIDIYFKKIHPILPVLDEEEFRGNHAGGIVPEPLAHAVCLVAAKDSEAAPYLRLNESTTPLAPREFCSRLHGSIMAALRTPVKFEKITLIRMWALASLHSEGQDGGEEASMCLTQAMHATQTLGLHLGQQTSVASGDDRTTKRLFWCLWSMDRINNCIYGRPVMMHDIDIAIEPFECGESGFPAFELWLWLCRTLNKIITFYRPGNPLTVTGWEENFPSFEEGVEESNAWNEPQSVLTTLHLFYLLIAILSHRSRGVKYISRSTPSYVRQSLCSIELHRLMNSDLFDSLHPLPIVPYALSLALSVAYQHLRHAQLQHQQENARADFRACCQALQKLRRTWSSADIIATIAKKVLEELNKATDLSTFRVGRSHESERASPGICAASLARPSTLIDAADQNTEADAAGAVLVDGQPSGAINPEWFGLFEGIDDIIGTYMDPNYPVNLDDFSFVDDLSPWDWNVAQT